MANQVAWITFAPISNLAIDYFGISLLQLNMLSIVYFIIYVVFVFLGSWTLDHKSLRFAVCFGGFCTFIGGWIRVFGYFGYAGCMVGQIIAAFGQPFLLAAPP
jgi:hypothetical protein